MAKRSITFVISSLRSGGAERVLSILTSALSSRGHRVSVVSLSDDAPFYAFSPTVRIFKLGLSGKSASMIDGVLNNVRRIWGLGDAIRATEPDVVISFLDRLNIRVLIANWVRSFGVPVIVSERSVPGVRHLGRVWEWLRRYTYPSADAVVVQSEDAARFFPWVEKGRLYTIPNPVITPDMGNLDVVIPEPPFLVTVARLSEEKRISLMIRAFAEAFPIGPMSLVVIGDGPLRKDLEEEAKALGIEERVRFLGRLTNPHSVVMRATAYLCTSRVEGFPMAVCEALALGVPVAATVCPGAIREIVLNGKNGYCVSDAELVSAIRRTVDEFERLKPNCSAISDRYSLSHAVEAWERLIDSL